MIEFVASSDQNELCRKSIFIAFLHENLSFFLGVWSLKPRLIDIVVLSFLRLIWLVENYINHHACASCASCASCAPRSPNQSPNQMNQTEIWATWKWTNTKTYDKDTTHRLCFFLLCFSFLSFFSFLCFLCFLSFLAFLSFLPCFTWPQSAMRTCSHITSIHNQWHGYSTTLEVWPVLEPHCSIRLANSCPSSSTW